MAGWRNGRFAGWRSERFARRRNGERDVCPARYNPAPVTQNGAPERTSSPLSGDAAAFSGMNLSFSIKN